MEHENVYRLSERYAPPNINLRVARIFDDYGEERFATHPIEHNHPEDVSRNDLDAYPSVWSFMDLSDMLFYLYPVAKEFEADPDTMDDWCCVSSFLFCLNLGLKDGLAAMNRIDQEAIREGLQWLHEIDSASDDPMFDNPIFNYRELRQILGLDPLSETH